MVFASVSGLVDIGVTPGGYVFGEHGPDGDADSPYGDFYTAVDGISGYLDSNRVAMLVGVFLDDTEPANPAPGSLDFSDGGMIGHIFSSLAPQLRQVFFIGDGLTGSGTGSLQMRVMNIENCHALQRLISNCGNAKQIYNAVLQRCLHQIAPATT